eukprot:scaffold95753_cov70-Phaeocystis_antarctica.AAC.1
MTGCQHARHAWQRAEATEDVFGQRHHQPAVEREGPQPQHPTPCELLGGCRRREAEQQHPALRVRVGVKIGVEVRVGARVRGGVRVGVLAGRCTRRRAPLRLLLKLLPRPLPRAAQSRVGPPEKAGQRRSGCHGRWQLLVLRGRGVSTCSSRPCAEARRCAARSSSSSSASLRAAISLDESDALLEGSSTAGPWHAACGMRHAACGMWHVVCAWQMCGMRMAWPPPPLAWVWRTSSALSSGSSEASRPAPCPAPCSTPCSSAAAPCSVGKRCSSANLTPGRSSRRVTPCSEAKARAWASVAVAPAPPPAPVVAARLVLAAAPGGEAEAIPRGGGGGGEGGDSPSNAGSRDRPAANDASSSPASGSTGHDELRVASSSAPPKPLPPARAAASAAAGTPSSPKSAMRSVATKRWRMPVGLVLGWPC